MQIQQAKVQTQNWLSQLQDSRLVNQISIPGSHNSCAFQTPHLRHKLFTWFIWKTQDYDIEQQLKIGIRLLDVRLRCQPSEPLSVCHGSVNLGSFANIIRHVIKFLKSNKKQFVILLLQKEQGTSNPVECGIKIIQEIITEAKHDVEIFKYDQRSKKLPTLKELRGKIWIMEAFAGNHKRLNLIGNMSIPTYCEKATLTDNQTFIVQNYWEGPEQLKKEQIMAVLKTDKKQLLKINFISQATFPRFYALKYNSWFQQLVIENQLRQLGIVIFDFPSQELVKLIIQRNF